MTSLEIYEMLPNNFKKMRDEIIESGGEFEFIFDNFKSITIETIDSKKFITSAIYTEPLLDEDFYSVIEWYIKDNKFKLFCDNILMAYEPVDL